MSASAVSVIASTLEVSADQAPATMTIETLFSTYVDFVWRSLRHFGVAESDLEDQAQEVFVVVHSRFDEWDGQQPRAWLFAIARRCAAAYRRRGHRRHEFPVETLPERGRGSDPVARLDVDRVGRALASLDEKKRAAFILHDVEEMPMREIADALGCSIPAVAKRLYAARQQLAKMLK